MLFEDIDLALSECVDEDGIIIDELKLAEVYKTMEKKNFCTKLAHWYKNLEADAEAYKAQEAHFKKRKQVAENKAEGVKNYLAKILEGEKFEADDKSVKCSFRKSESVEIPEDFDVYSLADIDEALISYKKPEANKTAIKEYLKKGNKIEGISIVTNNNMSIK